MERVTASSLIVGRKETINMIITPAEKQKTRLASKKRFKVVHKARIKKSPAVTPVCEELIRIVFPNSNTIEL